MEGTTEVQSITFLFYIYLLDYSKIYLHYWLVACYMFFISLEAVFQLAEKYWDKSQKTPFGPSDNSSSHFNLMSHYLVHLSD